MSEGLNIFLKEIQHYTYGEKYRRWEEYLAMESQSDNYLLLLGYFLESFPFNYKYWAEYIQLTKFEEHKTALRRNPKSFELWVSYISNFKQMEQNPQKYREQLQNAIIEIGADSRSLFLYDQFYETVGENIRFQFFKKIFTRGLIGLEQMYDKFTKWFENITEAQIKSLAIKELKNLANSMSIEGQRQHLKQLIDSTYQKTISYRDARLKLQQKIKHPYFDGSEQLGSQKEVWRDLIALQRSNGVVENVSYCYQRSLMAMTDDIDHWEQTFHYMQNETNKYMKVLSILRNNKIFFIKFDVDLYFYWCDLQERDVPNNARNMYQQIAKLKPTFEVYKRWIQFQIRDKKLENAKNIYDSLLLLFQTDLELISYILVEYSQFIVRHYKDFQFAKKLLKTYIDHLPFNKYLCLKYLQFMKNFQNKEGYYEQLMQTINDAIGKAYKNLNHDDFSNLIKTLKYYLRSTLSSIYLIKLSQQKMLEAQQRLTKLTKTEVTTGLE